jgi:hypothetical protein
VTDRPEGPAPGWWLASDGNWYPPDQRPAAPPPPARGGYGPPGAYGQAVGYGYGYGVAPVRSTNGAAVAALVLGCVQFAVWILATIPAIICGHVALSQIKRTGQEGRGMAIAGLVLGYLGLAVFVAFVVLVLVAAPRIDSSQAPLP